MAILPTRRTESGRGQLSRLHEQMDDVLSSFFEGWDIPFLGRTRWPVVDIAETEEQILVRAEVPGCKAGDIDISVHGNMLTISGERKQEEETKEKGYYHLESYFGSFRRDLTLPAEVNPARVDAVCKEGVLTITLAKAEKAKAVKVRVKGQ